jgi:hypothetical protein
MEGTWVISLLIALLVVMWVFGAIGALIAREKGRAWAGFWWSYFLGPIGWVIAALLLPSTEVEARRQEEVAEARAFDDDQGGHARLSQLEQLSNLHDRGALSDSEFEDEKRRVLAG